MRDHTMRQIRSASGAHRGPAVRGANAIDRYSLALQLIQVYPIILAGVAIVFPVEWLRVLVAVLGLVIWTAWAVIRERNTEAAGTYEDGAHQPSINATPHSTNVTTTSSASTTTTPDVTAGIRIDIWLHPHHSCGQILVGHRPGHRQVAPRVHCAFPREAPPTASESCQRAGA